MNDGQAGLRVRISLAGKLQHSQGRLILERPNVTISHHRGTDGVKTHRPSWVRRKQKAIVWVTGISGCLAFWSAVAWVIYSEL